MTLENCVRDLYQRNSNYLYPEHAANQASSLEALSNDLYSDPLRFLYELLQNADDAGSSSIYLSMINKTYLVVAHKGKPFDEADVRGLCSVGNSTKSGQSDATGYKGLGFKSIFGKSRWVMIMSRGEYFRFDANHSFPWNSKEIDRPTWEQKNQRKFAFPWQICPIWTEMNELTKSIHRWILNNQDQFNVAIILSLQGFPGIATVLNELRKKPHIILFLRHICEIDIELGSDSRPTIRKEKQKDNSVIIYYENNLHSQWLVTHRTVNVSAEVKSDRHLPEKMRRVEQTEISFAVKVDLSHGKRIVSVGEKESFLFAYVPTNIGVYGFRLLINANFMTNANREQLHTESKWNENLFARIPHEIVRWVKELNDDPHWCNSAFDLLPKPTVAVDALAQKYNENCSRALNENKFIKTKRGHYLSADEAIIDETKLSEQEFISTEAMRAFVISKFQLPPQILPPQPFIETHERLAELKVKIFDWSHAAEMLATSAFDSTLSSTKCLQLINYVFEKREKKEVIVAIQRLPFIMGENGQLRTVHTIYFPSPFNNVLWRCNDKAEVFIHHELMSKLNDPVKEWLTRCGMTERTNRSFVERVLIPQASTFITHDNALETIRHLLLLFQNGEIHANDLRNLGDLPLLTLNNQLVPAKVLYLSAIYQPHLPLENLETSKPNYFLSRAYVDAYGFHQDWRNFFLYMGVQDEINIINVTNPRSLPFTYILAQNRIIFGLKSNSVHCYENCINLRFLEETENNFEFAMQFWDYVLRNIDARYLNQPVIAHWGQQDRYGRNRVSEVNNYPKWFIREHNCIPVRLLSLNGPPTTQCLKGRDVFDDRLRPIVGHFLPIFEHTAEINDDWRRFFQFKTLTVEDRINLLCQIRLYSQHANGCDPDNQARIQHIYSNLLRNYLPSTNPTQRQSYRDLCRSKNLCLLSSPNSSFEPADQLCVWCIDGLQAPSGLPVLELNRANRWDPNLPKLLEIFDVREIRTIDLVHSFGEATPCRDLSYRFQHHYFQSWLESHDGHHIDLVRLNSLEFFETDRIDVSMRVGSFHVTSKTVHAEENRLYVKKPWRSCQELSETMCDLLNLPRNAFQSQIQRLINASNVQEWWYQLDISSDDSASVYLTGVSRDQFKESIERDNRNLFDRLEDFHSDATGPLDVLIQGLEAQNSPWGGYIYHYTHIENAASILHNKALMSRKLAMEKGFKDSAASTVIRQTRSEVMNYARFSFRPQTPSQLCVENLGSKIDMEQYGNIPMCPVPIIFRISLKALRSLPSLEWQISLGTMASPHSDYGSSMDIVRQFDFEGVFSDTRANRGKFAAQQEFLIKDRLDFDRLPRDAICLLCQDDNAETYLRNMMKSHAGPQYEIMIDHSCFFGVNPRVNIQEDLENQSLVVTLIDNRGHRSNGILIIQFECDHDEDVVVTGNILGIFQEGDRTTIYGKQNLEVFVRHHAYAVYYLDGESERWLIHANHQNPVFNNSHQQLHTHFYSHLLD